MGLQALVLGIAVRVTILARDNDLVSGLGPGTVLILLSVVVIAVTAVIVATTMVVATIMVIATIMVTISANLGACL